MRAILCKELGPADKLVIEDVPSPQVSGDGVKVKVKAAGLNFPDTLIIEGKYQIKPELPFSPGGEMAGRPIWTWRLVLVTVPVFSAHADAGKITSA